MKVTDEIVHEDGSATYTFDMTEEERSTMVEQGILWCLVAGITGVTPTAVMKEWKETRDD